MNNNLCQVKEDILVVLDSRNATTIYNQTFNSDVEWDLTDVLAMPKQGVEFTVSIMNATIPIGAHNINDTNNTLFLKNIVTNVEWQIVVAAGNYTITSLLTYLRANTPIEYQYTYLDYRNRIFMYNTTNDFQILSSSTMWEPLGLQRNTTLTSVLKTLIFPSQVNMSGLRNINVHLDNLNTKNIASLTNAASTIIGNIPIDVNSLGVVNYNLSNAYEIPVPIASLDYINILLKDDLGNFIDNNGIHWNMTLKFSYHIQQDFTTETLHENINKNKQKIKIVQTPIMNMEIPKIFRSREEKQN